MLSRSFKPTPFFFFFNDTATTEIYTLSLHDALPISTCSTTKARKSYLSRLHPKRTPWQCQRCNPWKRGSKHPTAYEDRKSTRLNSSHANISYAVFCLKKKKEKDMTLQY